MVVERRKNCRVTTVRQLRVRDEEDAGWCNYELKDISLKGFQAYILCGDVTSHDTLRQGQTQEVLIELHLESNICIRAKARVVRVIEEGLYAFEFTDIDADSFFHLNNLIKYNNPSTHEIQDEYSTLKYE